MNILPISNLRNHLKSYQIRLRTHVGLLTMTELAAIAGVHRDTLYSLINGERVSERSQYAISKALQMVNESSANQPSRLMSIELGRGGPKLRFGLAEFDLFKGV
jgi:hypothetical protein